MLQDHLDVRAQWKPRLETVVGADGMARGSVEAVHGRGLLTMFGNEGGGVVEVRPLANQVARTFVDSRPSSAVEVLPSGFTAETSGDARGLTIEDRSCSIAHQAFGVGIALV